MQFVNEFRAEILLDRRHTAANSNIALLCNVFRTLQRCLNSIGDEMKGCSALHLDGFAWMMGKNKRRDMIWRLLAPPSFPRFIRPRTTHRSEHVPPQNPSADVLHGSLCPLIIDSCRAAFLGRASASTCAWRRTTRTTQGHERREGCPDSGGIQRRNHQARQQMH